MIELAFALRAWGDSSIAPAAPWVSGTAPAPAVTAIVLAYGARPLGAARASATAMLGQALAPQTCTRRLEGPLPPGGAWTTPLARGLLLQLGVAALAELPPASSALR